MLKLMNSYLRQKQKGKHSSNSIQTFIHIKEKDKYYLISQLYQNG